MGAHTTVGVAVLARRILIPSGQYYFGWTRYRFIGIESIEFMESIGSFRLGNND